MEENNKSSRLFYITLAVIITVIAILIVTAAVAKRSGTEEIPSGDNGSTTAPVNPNPDTQTGTNSNTLPTFSLPVSGVINYDFSDSIPVFSQTMGDYRTHLGVDIAGELGKEVLAVADGTVTNIWTDPFMGVCVSLEHSGNAVSIYKNLAPEVAEGLVIGSSVKSGDVIGAIGETAMNEIAEEPHLHYELKVNDKHVDPKDHFQFPTVDTNYEDSAEQG